MSYDLSAYNLEAAAPEFGHRSHTNEKSFEMLLVLSPDGLRSRDKWKSSHAFLVRCSAATAVMESKWLSSPQAVYRGEYLRNFHFMFLKLIYFKFFFTVFLIMYFVFSNFAKCAAPEMLEFMCSSLFSCSLFHVLLSDLRRP